MKYLIATLIFYNSSLFSQVNSFEFSETCDFITITDQGFAYLGTTSGLFRQYGTGLPEKIDLSRLDNSNIQSLFYTDTNRSVWFSTYNRIIKLNPSNHTYDAYPIVNPLQDTVNSDYYVFGLDKVRNQLWVKQHKDLYSFNLHDFKSNKICDSVEGRRILEVNSEGFVTQLLSYFYTYTPQVITIGTRDNKCLSVSSWINWPEKCMANDMLMLDSLHVLIGTSKGLYVGNLKSLSVHQIPGVLTDGVKAIGPYSKNSWIIAFKNNGLKLLHRNSFSFDISDFPYSGINHPVDRITSTKTGEIILSSYGNMIYYFNPGKIKFNDFSPPFTITNNPGFNDKLNQYVSEIEITSGGNPFTFTQASSLVSYPRFTNSILSIAATQFPIRHPEDAMLYRYFTANDEIYGSFLNQGIYKLQGHQWEPIRYPENMVKNCNYYYPVNDSLGIASLNQESIILWNIKTGHLKKEIIFSGDIYNQQLSEDGESLYLSTDQGILQYSIENEEFEILAKTFLPCLCLLRDQDDKIWFSSNNGIYTFNPIDKTTRQFHVTDGVSAEKYIQRKCIALSPDSLLFYHEKGVTLVTPPSIRLYKGESSIFISNFKLNDVDFNVKDTLSYCSSFTVPYIHNTISFDVSSIDWSDPQHTDLQYRLSGYDDTWVRAVANEAFIRYANLPPGTYKLLIQGQNADGIWNTNQKEIQIVVNPPFWMTWWFISLVLLACLGIIYLIFRSYYQRKLEKKNQVLREQSLIIEKQQALEHERTRIAAEMHDDLGSGLTTIRYLSDKALVHAKDAAETEQIQRIAEHSNRLVRNMSEIIWAMNSRFDNAENLTGYLRRYASEFLHEHQLLLEFRSNDDFQQELHVGGEKRRNIFLVFKEMLHNTVKYAGAGKVIIDVHSEKEIVIRIMEVGGKGFDASIAAESGNGLYNARKRMETIGGKIEFEKQQDGMQITISVPLEKITHA